MAKNPMGCALRGVYAFALLLTMVIAWPQDSFASGCNICTPFTENVTEECPCGQTGLITRQRTANPGGVCGTYSAWTQTGNTCAGATPVTSYLRTSWVALPNSDTAKFNTPSGRMINNCPAGWVQTEIRDDSDSVHSLAEDDGSGTRRQLCLYAPNVTILYDWVRTNEACPANTVNTETYDSYGGSTNKESKYYMYYHYMSEEESTSDDWKFCLGAAPPASLTTRWAVGGCAADETALYLRHNNEDNMNDEDGKHNRTLCAKVTMPAQTGPDCTPAAPPAPPPGGGGSGGGSGGGGVREFEMPAWN